MDIIGHKTRSMLDRYNIIDDTDRRNALRKTDEFRRTRTKPAQSASREKK
jgi:hypothetical protein